MIRRSVASFATFIHISLSGPSPVMTFKQEEMGDAEVMVTLTAEVPEGGARRRRSVSPAPGLDTALDKMEAQLMVCVVEHVVI